MTDFLTAESKIDLDSTRDNNEENIPFIVLQYNNEIKKEVPHNIYTTNVGYRPVYKEKQ